MHLTLLLSLAFRLILPLVCGPLTPTPVVVPPPPPLVFVLAGQSNMLRSGEHVEVPAAPEDALIRPGLLRWTTGPGSAPGTVRVPNGPGLAFARAVARSGREVVLVGCALGGTGIRSWQRGAPLYEECVAAARSTGLPVAGLLFAQGEADAKEGPPFTEDGAARAPNHWDVLFGRFVAAFREDVGQPDLPVFYGRLAQTTSTVHPYWASIQAQQDGIALPGVTEVAPEPVGLVDGVHWDAPSYARQGERYATAWLAP